MMKCMTNTELCSVPQSDLHVCLLEQTGSISLFQEAPLGPREGPHRKPRSAPGEDSLGSSVILNVKLLLYHCHWYH